MDNDLRQLVALALYLLTWITAMIMIVVSPFILLMWAFKQIFL